MPLQYLWRWLLQLEEVRYQNPDTDADEDQPAEGIGPATQPAAYPSACVETGGGDEEADAPHYKGGEPYPGLHEGQAQTNSQ